MDHVPLAILRISPEEQEMVYCFRLLPPDLQAGIALMIAANIPPKDDEQQGMTYSDPPRLIAVK